MVSELPGCNDHQISRVISKIRAYAGGQKVFVSVN